MAYIFLELKKSFIENLFMTYNLPTQGPLINYVVIRGKWVYLGVTPGHGWKEVLLVPDCVMPRFCLYNMMFHTNWGWVPSLKKNMLVMS
jgi:hypothetical protein